MRVTHPVLHGAQELTMTETKTRLEDSQELRSWTGSNPEIS